MDRMGGMGNREQRTQVNVYHAVERNGSVRGNSMFDLRNYLASGWLFGLQRLDG
ncbi:hypothetical protein RISK_003960 [Rhodopirellula islandica]|uniref:Uncharacterized protein n=1 Tax=Rhodopirellula islandica TaxID=595434 RepID=A0A0J1BBU4_RHOIS|nr:hypothetical protein RISK_003960 [Rhodopirellula islandica]